MFILNGSTTHLLKQMLEHSLCVQRLHRGPKVPNGRLCVINVGRKRLECLWFPVMFNKVAIHAIHLDVQLLDGHMVSQIGLEVCRHCGAFRGHSGDHVSEDAALIGVKLLQAEAAAFSLSVGNCHTACQASQLCKQHTPGVK